MLRISKERNENRKKRAYKQNLISILESEIKKKRPNKIPLIKLKIKEYRQGLI